MIEFKEFQIHMRTAFDKMCKKNLVFVKMNIDKEVLWNLYLDSFPEGTNPIYRTNREHDCNCCKSFIRNMGGVAMIDEFGKLKTIWDFTTAHPFDVVVEKLDAYVKAQEISGYFITSESEFGRDYTWELKDNKKWDHLYLEVPQVCRASKLNVDSTRGQKNSSTEVFQRALETITLEAIDTFLELTAQNSIRRGAEFVNNVNAFKVHKRSYLETENKNYYAYYHGFKAHAALTHIRNSAVGTLLVDLSEGVDINEAIRKFGNVMDPYNYKHPSNIFTQKMKEDAEKKLTELGYIPSLARRHAKLEDITVNDILFVDRNTSIKGKGALDDILGAPSASNKTPKFDKVQEVSIEKFISDVLPTAESIEVYLAANHSKNVVNLVAPVNSDSPSMFTWGNNFSWNYSGGITDSDIKDRVKKAGGKINAPLRISLGWSNGDDLDLSVKTNGRSQICYYGQKRALDLELDVDMNAGGAHNTVDPVENIVAHDLSKLKPGLYEIIVNNFARRSNQNGGFSVEVELLGDIYTFDYADNEVHHKTIGSFIVDANQNVTINGFSSKGSTRLVGGIPSNQFVTVSTIMLSPNYWENAAGVGNKHFFFMLKDMKSDEVVKGFFNEFIKKDLITHKNLFEALSSKLVVAESDEQLCGLGFSSTIPAELIVKVNGVTSRVIKIKF